MVYRGRDGVSTAIHVSAHRIALAFSCGLMSNQRMLRRAGEDDGEGRHRGVGEAEWIAGVSNVGEGGEEMEWMKGGWWLGLGNEEESVRKWKRRGGSGSRQVALSRCDLCRR